MGRPSVDRLSVRHQLHTHYHSTDIVSALTINLPHATLIRNSSPSALDIRVTRPFPLFCNRRGRETKTSSDASNEAPESARNDTSREAKLHGLAVSSSRVIPMKFLRLPFDASHVRGGGLGETALPRGNSVLPRRFESLRLALVATLYQKSGLLTEISRRETSAAGLSGLS